MKTIVLANGDYLNLAHYGRARIRTTRRTEPGAGWEGVEYPVPKHLWVKMAWGEVYEFEGEEMERVLEAIDSEWNGYVSVPAVARLDTGMYPSRSDLREGHNADPVERLAAHCHDEQWSGWMKYMLAFCEPYYDPKSRDALVIPGWAVERWMRQMRTPYADLPEGMKEYDREEARKILKVLEEA